MQRPLTVTVTAVLSVVEAVVGVVVTLATMVGATTQANVSNLGAVVFWVAAALGVLGIAWQYVKARPWARTALVTWHLLVIFSLLSLLQLAPVLSTLDRVGIVGGVLASVLALGLVFTPSARAHIVDTRSRILED